MSGFGFGGLGVREVCLGFGGLGVWGFGGFWGFGGLGFRGLAWFRAWLACVGFRVTTAPSSMVHEFKERSKSEPPRMCNH